MPFSVPSSLCNGRFQVAEKLGEGCFGAVFRGTDKTGGGDVAIKVEFPDCGDHDSLANEDRIMRQLAKPEQQEGFARVFWFGCANKNYCLVMELLGQSLDDTIEACGGKLEIKSVVLVAVQVLMRIEYLHSKCLVHRDIKPENFMWGVKDKQHHLYLIDLGMATKYFDKDKQQHLREDREQSLVGTARYASINAHENKTQSRRDDLEAIGHLFFYMLRGKLPWSGLKARTDEEKYQKIGEKKKSFPISELCNGHPQEFASYLQYCRALPWEERPDYERLQQQMSAVRKRIGPVRDHDLQWMNEDVDLGALTPVTPWRGQSQPEDIPNAYLAAENAKCFFSMPRVPKLPFSMPRPACMKTSRPRVPLSAAYPGQQMRANNAVRRSGDYEAAVRTPVMDTE